MNEILQQKNDLLEVDPESLLNFTSEIGRQLMLSGAEVYRVENSLEHIIFAYGYKEYEVFAIPSCIIINISNEGRNYTKTVRIKTSVINMALLCSLNDLSRMVCDKLPTMSEAQELLEQKINSPLYPVLISYLGYGAAAAFFTLFWGGRLVDAIVALAGGFMIRAITYYLKDVKANIFFTYLLSSMLLAVFASIIQFFVPMIMFDKVITGGIMLLVPGVAITNVFRDVLSGDFVTAVSKLAEVLIISLAIAFGIALPISGINFILQL